MSGRKFILVVATAMLFVLQSPFANAQTELESWRGHMSPAGDAHLAGDYSAAERHYSAALELAEKFDTDGQYLEASLSGLAGLYFAQGRYADAALRFRQAISIAEALYDPDDPKRSSLDLYRELLIESEAQQRRVAIPERGTSPVGQAQQVAQPIPPVGAVAIAQPAPKFPVSPPSQPTPAIASPPVASPSVSSLSAPAVPLTGIQQSPVPAPEPLDPNAVRRPVPVPPPVSPAPPIVASAPPAPAETPQVPIATPPTPASPPVAEPPEVAEPAPALAEAIPRLPGPAAPPDSSPPPLRGTAPKSQVGQPQSTPEPISSALSITDQQPLPPTITEPVQSLAHPPAPAPAPPAIQTPAPDPIRLAVSEVPQQTPVATPEPLESAEIMAPSPHQASGNAPVPSKLSETKPAPEPIAEAAPEPITEAAPEIAATPAPEPAIDPSPKPTTALEPAAADAAPGLFDWVRSLIPEPTPEPVPDETPEPVAEIAPQPEPMPTPEQNTGESAPTGVEVQSEEAQVVEQAASTSHLQPSDGPDPVPVDIPGPTLEAADAESVPVPESQPSAPTKSFLDRVRDLIPEATPDPLAEPVSEPATEPDAEPDNVQTADATTDRVETSGAEIQTPETGEAETIVPEPVNPPADVAASETEPDASSAAIPAPDLEPSDDANTQAGLQTETSSNKGIFDWVRGLLPEPTPDPTSETTTVTPSEPVSGTIPEPASAPTAEPAASEPTAVVETPAAEPRVEALVEPERPPEPQPLPPEQLADIAPSPEVTKVRPPKLIAPEQGVIDQAPVPVPDPVLPTDTVADLAVPPPELSIVPEEAVIEPNTAPSASQLDVPEPGQAPPTTPGPPAAEPEPVDTPIGEEVKAPEPASEVLAGPSADTGPTPVPEKIEATAAPSQPTGLEEVLAVDEPASAEPNVAGKPLALGARGRLEKAMSQAEIARAALEEKPGVPLNPAPVRKPRGALAETEAAYKQDLNERLQRVNRNHPDAAAGYYKLGRLYHRQGRYELAGGMYQKALDIREASLAPDDPQLLETAESYAKLLRHSGLSERAKALMERIRGLAAAKDEAQ